MSDLACRWDRCTAGFPTREQLLLHITEEHVKPMKPMPKDEIIMMKKLDKAKFESDTTADTDHTPSTFESSESIAPVKASNLGESGHSSVNGRSEKKHNSGTPSRESSQDVEKQLTLEDSVEHAVPRNGNANSTTVDDPLTMPLKPSSTRNDRGVKFLTGSMSLPHATASPCASQLSENTQSFLPQTQAAYYSQDSSQSLQ